MNKFRRATLVSSLALVSGLGLSPLALAQDAAGDPNATEVVFGMSAPLSGPVEDLGKRMQAGANAYFSKVNAAGGVNGRKIVLKVVDDKYNADATKANTDAFIKENAFALFGYVGSPTVLAAVPAINAAKIPLVGPFTGAAALRDPVNPYIFNVRASYGDEMRKIVDTAMATGYRRIGVLYQNDAFGKDGLEGAMRAMAVHGLAPSATAAVEPNSTNVKEAVDKIAASKPDAVIMVAANNTVAQFVRDMRSAGQRPLFYNVSFGGSKYLANALGKDGAGVQVSQVVPFPWSKSIPVVKEYQEAMAAANDRNFDFTSLEGYLAAKVAVLGLTKTGKDLTRAKYIAALNNIKNHDMGGFMVSLSPKNHSGSQLVDVTIIDSQGGFVH